MSLFIQMNTFLHMVTIIKIDYSSSQWTSNKYHLFYTVSGYEDGYETICYRYSVEFLSTSSNMEQSFYERVPILFVSCTHVQVLKACDTHCCCRLHVHKKTLWCTFKYL